MKKRLIAFLLLLLAWIDFRSAAAQAPPADGSSLTTSTRLEEQAWWPTKGDAARSLYAGSATCATCHAPIAAMQQTTPMFQSAAHAAQSRILSEHDHLQFHEGSLDASIQRTPSAVTYTVSDGQTSNAADVVWAFGAGVIGQTFVLQKGNTYLEGRVSYYTRLSGLDISIGHSALAPAGTGTALGHVMDGTATRRCFSCHTTTAFAAGIFEPEKALPGVQCEACHGPGAQHATAMKAQRFQQAATTITNPGRMSPSESVDFCGACHRTWADVVMQSAGGIAASTVRFQPYLLENSRCWGKGGDSRLTCIACHDPHKPLVHEAAAYDNKCLACHSAGQSAPGLPMAKLLCKVATRDCTGCHMPKYELPQAHAAFTDHFIRVVRNGKDAARE